MDEEHVETQGEARFSPAAPADAGRGWTVARWLAPGLVLLGVGVLFAWWLDSLAIGVAIFLALILIVGASEWRARRMRRRVELNMAALEGDVEKVRRLLAGGAPVDVAANCNPVFTATRSGETEVVEALLAAGAPATAPVDGVTPLCAAALRGRTQIVALLLDHGAEVNARSPGADANGMTPALAGATPLCAAAAGGHRETVELLLARGANPRIRTHTGASPLDLANLAGAEVCARVLVAAEEEVSAGA